MFVLVSFSMSVIGFMASLTCALYSLSKLWKSTNDMDRLIQAFLSALCFLLAFLAALLMSRLLP